MPSSSLVEVEDKVGVEVGVEVEVAVGRFTPDAVKIFFGQVWVGG